MKILVLNSGSSSLKYQVIDMETEEMLVKGYFERIGQQNSFLTHKVNGEKHHFEHPAKNHEKAIQFVMKRLTSDHYGVFKSLDELGGIGHRVVQGGEKYSRPVLITDDVISEIEKCSDLAPLHNPAAILGIEACQKVVPNKPMVAVFDTAFHQTISKEKYIYPIPYEYYEKYHVRKYGFHGTSHQYVANRVAEIIGKDIKDLKIVNCHLGQGASVCAIQNGKSVETSMGLTPLGGIPMGTRSGDLDPSVVTYLMKKEELDADDVEEVLNREDFEFKTQEMNKDIVEANYNQVCIDEKGKLYKNLKTYQVSPGFGTIYAYVDTADTGDDYLCGAVYGLLDKEPYILDVLFTDEGMEITEEECADMLYRNNVNLAYIESNNGGRGFARNVKRILKEKYRSNKCVIKPFTQTANKQARILSSSHWVMEHIYFPFNWANRWKEFYKHITRYQKKGRNAHDDGADVLAGIYDKTVGERGASFGSTKPA